jgi:hypothetical protein
MNLYIHLQYFEYFSVFFGNKNHLLYKYDFNHVDHFSFSQSLIKNMGILRSLILYIYILV